MSQPSQLPRRFALHRRYDLTGISGTGVIAYGTQYPTGRITLAWCCSEVWSVAVYDDVTEVEQIHGHGGLTDVRWIDPKTSTTGKRSACNRRLVGVTSERWFIVADVRRMFWRRIRFRCDVW